jgi:hypothetical protein
MGVEGKNIYIVNNLRIIFIITLAKVMKNSPERAK